MTPSRRFLFISLWLALSLASCPQLTQGAVSMTIGQNFTSFTYGQDLMGLPPDPNGFVGPNDFVELINGSFTPYDKATGQSRGTITDADFWTSSGITLPSGYLTTDPRIIFDPSVQRWFASMVDVNGNVSDPTLYANNFLLAFSATSDPNGGWKGFRIRADPNHGYFADFPTLGVDSNAVYLAGDFFHGSDNPVGPGLVSFPKQDLLASNVNNRTWSGVMTYAARGQVIHPVMCLDGSASGRILSVTDIGNDTDPHSNLVSFAVQNAGGAGATLSPSVFVQTASWMVPWNTNLCAPALTATQPDGTSMMLMANDARLAANVYAVGGVLYAAHSTELNDHIAIRWYRLRAADSVLLEMGTIADPSLDMFFPSIAANSSGVVVIAYNASGTNTTVSCFAQAGQTIGGVTSFGDRLLLQAGATSYHGDDEVLVSQLYGTPPVSRWGDYSATSVDPSDPNRFWTEQMYPSDAANNDVWSTQITELITALPQPPPPTLGIVRAGANVTISWPTAAASHQLQSSASLAMSATWSNVLTVPVTNGSSVSVSMPIASGAQFFRLH